VTLTITSRATRAERSGTCGTTTARPAGATATRVQLDMRLCTGSTRLAPAVLKLAVTDTSWATLTTSETTGTTTSTTDAMPIAGTKQGSPESPARLSQGQSARRFEATAVRSTINEMTLIRLAGTADLVPVRSKLAISARVVIETPSTFAGKSAAMART